MYYKLDKNKNVVESSLSDWGSFIKGEFTTNYKHVGDDSINGYRVSTVFIGVCHNYNPRSKIPVVFETMIFKDVNFEHIYVDRYSTWQEAEEGHKKAIEWVRNGCNHE